MPKVCSRGTRYIPSINDKYQQIFSSITQPLRPVDSPTFESLTLNGDLTVLGSFVELGTSVLQIKDNIILVDYTDSEQNPLTTLNRGGLAIFRGSVLNPYLVLYDETSGTLRIGYSQTQNIDSVSQSNLQRVAVIQDNPSEGIATWNTTSKQLECSDSIPYPVIFTQPIWAESGFALGNNSGSPNGAISYTNDGTSELLVLQTFNSAGIELKPDSGVITIPNYTQVKFGSNSRIFSNDDGLNLSSSTVYVPQGVLDLNGVQIEKANSNDIKLNANTVLCDKLKVDNEIETESLNVDSIENINQISLDAPFVNVEQGNLKVGASNIIDSGVNGLSISNTANLASFPDTIKVKNIESKLEGESVKIISDLEIDGDISSVNSVININVPTLQLSNSSKIQIASLELNQNSLSNSTGDLNVKTTDSVNIESENIKLNSSNAGLHSELNDLYLDGDNINVGNLTIEEGLKFKNVTTIINGNAQIEDGPLEIVSSEGLVFGTSKINASGVYVGNEQVLDTTVEGELLLKNHIVLPDGNSNFKNSGTTLTTPLNANDGIVIGGTGNTITLTNGARVTGLSSPIADTDAISKSYLEQYLSGQTFKESVIVATTLSDGNIDFSSPPNSIDSVAGPFNLGMRILVKNQTNEIQNGIYQVLSDGTWGRTSDFALGEDVTGASVMVIDGMINKIKTFIVSRSSPNIVVGTNAIDFITASSSGTVAYGEGLLYDNATELLQVNVDGTSIEFSGAEKLRIGAGAAGTGLTGGSGVALATSSNQSHVTQVGTIGNGTWNASTISVPYGGTGVSSIGNNLIPFGSGGLPLRTNSSLLFDGTQLVTPKIYVGTESATITNSGSKINIPSLISNNFETGNINGTGDITLTSVGNVDINGIIINNSGNISNTLNVTNLLNAGKVNSQYWTGNNFTETVLTDPGWYIISNVLDSTGGGGLSDANNLQIYTSDWNVLDNQNILITRTDRIKLKRYHNDSSNIRYLSFIYKISDSNNVLPVKVVSHGTTNTNYSLSFDGNGTLPNTVTSSSGTWTLDSSYGIDGNASLNIKLGGLQTTNDISSSGNINADGVISGETGSFSDTMSSTKVESNLIGPLSGGSITINAASQINIDSNSVSVETNTPVSFNQSIHTTQQTVSDNGLVIGTTTVSPNANGLVLNNKQIKGVSAPTDSGDVANKGYIDTLLNGLSFKSSVLVASSSSLDLSNPVLTIDSIGLGAGNRVLLVGQSNKIENGIYQFTDSSSVLTRTSDLSTGSHASGCYVIVLDGATYNDQAFICDNLLGNDIVGTNNLNFTLISSGGGGSLVPGNGINVAGSSVSLNVNNTEFAFESGTGKLELASSVAGEGMTLNSTNKKLDVSSVTHLNSVGTITSGKWQSTTEPIGVSYGGTGSSSFSTPNGFVYYNGSRMFNSDVLKISDDTVVCGETVIGEESVLTKSVEIKANSADTTDFIIQKKSTDSTVTEIGNENFVMKSDGSIGFNKATVSGTYDMVNSGIVFPAITSDSMSYSLVRSQYSGTSEPISLQISPDSMNSFMNLGWNGSGYEISTVNGSQLSLYTRSQVIILDDDAECIKTYGKMKIIGDIAMTNIYGDDPNTGTKAISLDSTGNVDIKQNLKFDGIYMYNDKTGDIVDALDWANFDNISSVESQNGAMIYLNGAYQLTLKVLVYPSLANTLSKIALSTSYFAPLNTGSDFIIVGAYGKIKRPLSGGDIQYPASYVINNVTVDRTVDNSNLIITFQSSSSGSVSTLAHEIHVTLMFPF